MPNQDWTLNASAPIRAASAAAGLTGKKKEQINGVAWLKEKHEELLAMNPDRAQKQFDKLDKNIQGTLQEFFGYTTYNPEEKSFGGRVWDVLTKPVDIALGALTNYGELISTPFRAVAGEDRLSAFFDQKMWEKYGDGKRVFDADREAIVDKAYSKEVSKIAKRISMGDSFGDIIQSLETDREFLAMEKFLSGKDQEAKNALRDYDDAKISWGRSFARMLQIEPKVGVSDQGLRGTAYKWVSGAADLIGDVAFDPLTYVGIPFKAIQMARFGLNSLLAQEVTNTGRALNMLGVGTGVEAAFKVPRVRAAFDEVGPLIKKVREAGPNSPEAARAMQEAEDLYPFFNPLTVIEMSKWSDEGYKGVENADAAMLFFKNSDALSRILVGRSGEISRVLPQYTVITKAKRGIAATARRVSGYDKAAASLADDVVDSAVEGIAKGDSEAEKLQLKRAETNLGRLRFWTQRAADRSMTQGYVFVGGQDATGKSLHLKSVDTVYTLARSFMSKYHARLLANTYALTKEEGERRLLISGLFETMADFAGIPKKGPVRVEFEKLMDKWRNPIYSEQTAVTQQLINEGIFPPGTLTHNPGNYDGIQRAVADHQLSNAAYIPNFHEVMDVYNKGMKVRSVSNTVNNSFVSALTDAWSAMNLIPRLGLRSAIDENLFHMATMPIDVMRYTMKGYVASISRRLVKRDQKYIKIGALDAVEKGFKEWQATGKISAGVHKAAVQEILGQRDIGVVARVMQKFFVSLTDDERAAAAASDLMAGKLLRRELVRRRFNFAKLSEEEAQYVDDLVRFGYVDEIDGLTSGFTAGISSGIAEGVPLGRAQQAQLYDLNPNVAEELKRQGIQFGRIFGLVHKYKTEYMANYLIQLSNRIDRNGIVGKIAVQYIDKPSEAIDQIVNYLKTDGADLFKRYDRYGKQDIRQFATDRYMHVRSILVGDDGELIPELVNMVRKHDVKTGEWFVTARNIDVPDLDAIIDKLPQQISGYLPRSTSPKNLANWLEEIFDEGFRVADRQVATLSREPVTYAYNLYYRKLFAGAQKRYEQRMLKEPNVTEAMAKDMAARRYSFLANEMALNRAGGFMDNPNFRSNAAYSARNLARYYRATEDFWRRANRAISPEAIVRLRMAAEGLDNFGWIHEDDQGDKYFILPVDEIMYSIYAPIVEMLTGERPKTMMPIRFTGKVKMLTPSLDPESALPTFSGPLTGFLVSALAPLIPEEYADDATRALLGSRAEGITIGQAITPSLLRRINQVLTASTGGMNEQIHSATMKSIAYYASIGKAPGSDAKPAEREMFIRDVRATARNIVAVRNVLGIFSPVSPGIADIRGIPKELLEVGFSSFKAEFNQLVAAEFESGNPEAYNTALRKWTRLYPGRLVYTVSETKMNTVGAVKKTKQAHAWIQANRPLVNKFRQASVFLMPQDAGFDWDAYAFMKREGYLESKTIEKYLEDIANVADENKYFDIARKYDDLIAGSTGVMATLYREQKENEQKAFIENRPYLKLKLEKSQAERPTQLKEDALQEMRELLDSGMAPKNSSASTIRRMINIYDQAQLTLNSFPGQTDYELELRRDARSSAAARIVEMAGMNQNALAFYNSVLKRLLDQ